MNYGAASRSEIESGIQRASCADLGKISRDNHIAARVVMLGLLFEAALPAASYSPPVLGPIWAEEATNRAMHLLRLVQLLETRVWTGRARPQDLISVLASVYRSLEIKTGPEAPACTAVLRELIETLVELFGPTVGYIRLSLNIDQLILPAYKRLALALLASELTIQALLHGFCGRHSAEITASLRVGSDRQAAFRFEDDGDRPGPNTRPGDSEPIVSALAGLLEADVAFGCSPLAGFAAELAFPV